MEFITQPCIALYVGDLSKDVEETMLYNMFASVGPVTSVRVCRNSATKESLGYAYVNFENEADAEKAIDVFNYELVNGKPMRVMRSQRDPSLRRSGAGNVFIKNLDENIDSKTLYDTFSAFGNILSCKIATEENGRSKGYGFIQFEKEEDAKIAIEKVNGMLICGLQVYVGKFKPKKEREKELCDNKFIKVFIKNFGESFNEDTLHEMFSKFGSIKSSKIMKNEDGTSKGFGFVDFEDKSSADAAVSELNNKELAGQILFVGLAQKEDEGQNVLHCENFKCNRGVNLYVKNLADSVTDDILRKIFSPYGTITSAKVMRDDYNRSKGFGFICYSSPEEASFALIEMNNRFVGRKPLYVAVAQPKEYRKIYTSQLKQHMNRISYMYQQNGSNNIPIGVQPQRYFQSPMSTVPAHQFHPPTHGSNETQNEDVAYIPAPKNLVTKNYSTQNADPSSRSEHSRSLSTKNNNSKSIIRTSRSYLQAFSAEIDNTETSESTRRKHSYWLAQNKRNSLASSEVHTQSPRLLYSPETTACQVLSTQQDSTPQSSFVQQTATSQAITSCHSTKQQDFISQHSSTQEAATSYPSEDTTCNQGPLTASDLANATPQERKLMLGERVYPQVKKYYPELASKITGMILEINNNDLLQILENSNLVKEKADEAFSVLEAHWSVMNHNFKCS